MSSVLVKRSIRALMTQTCGGNVGGLSPVTCRPCCCRRTCVALQVAAETSYLQLWVRIMLCDRRAEEGEADSAQGAKKEQAQDTLQLDPSAITSTNGGTHRPTHANTCTHQSTCQRKGTG